MQRLWKRGQNFTFQAAIPTHLRERFGASPVRISLGHVRCVMARRYARILSGHFELLLESSMSRKALSHSLKVLAEKIERLERQRSSANFRTLSQVDSPYDDVLDDGTVIRIEPDAEEVERERQRIQRAKQRIADIDAINADLTDIGDAIEMDGARWEGIQQGMRDEHDRLVDRLISVQAASMSSPTAPNAMAPLLSEVIDPYLKTKQESEVSENYLKGMPRRFQAFIDFAGDKPITDYRSSELHSFTAALSKVPREWSRDERLKTQSIRDVIEWNEDRKEKLDCLAVTAIKTGYILPVKGLFLWACSEHMLLNPFGNFRFSAPKSARELDDRQSFTTEELNRIFALAGLEKRLDDRMLPLLGLLTGARIGELTFLQAKDFRKTSDGYYYIYLSKNLTVDGKEKERAVKTKQSIRHIAVHEIFKTIGFINHINKLRPAAWVFPHLHGKNVRDPADTASKRMSRLLKDAGVYQEYIKVFHSLRHTAAEFYKRDLKMDENLMRPAAMSERRRWSAGRSSVPPEIPPSS